MCTCKSPWLSLYFLVMFLWEGQSVNTVLIFLQGCVICFFGIVFVLCAHTCSYEYRFVSGLVLL